MVDQANTAHKHDGSLAYMPGRGPVVWFPPSKVFLYSSCSWCGSVDPATLAKLLRNPQQQAAMELADWKYGWPHKAYFRCLDYAWGKFYTIHLMDATDEDKAVIEQAIGYSFRFGTTPMAGPTEVSWKKLGV